MSYDLYLRPSSGDLKAADIVEYLSARPNWNAGGKQSVYENADTGVYFSLDMDSEDRTKDDTVDQEYPLALNINYFRPSYFVLEAEPEVTALIETFDLAILDPQFGGMATGGYDPQLLIDGWSRGNEFGYASILANSEKPNLPFTYPTEKLLENWKWNFGRKRLQANLGDDVFVAKVSYLCLDGAAATCVVWTDGIPTAMPEVEYLLVVRRKYAPRRLFKRTQDIALVRWEDSIALRKRFATDNLPHASIPDYLIPPKAIVDYIESLRALDTMPEIIAPDQVLDRELVAKYLPSI